MKKNEFYVLRYYANYGQSNLRKISKATSISLGTLSKIINTLKENKLIDENGLTSKGKESLKPFEVKNAIIMAAGMSTRLAPLSFDKPKGLFEIKGEILIERQIKQLKEAGINDITLVLGYKKESFFYLGEKYDVKILINPSYETKNNCETLFLARERLSRTYICSCDQYFTINPFNKYEYQTFYTTVFDKHDTIEPRVTLGSNDRIIHLEKGTNGDYIILGFAFFNEEFSSSFRKLLERKHPSGELDNTFWENAFAKYINKLPPMYISRRENGTIFEFDNLKQLRAFDQKYIENTESIIMQNISKVLNWHEGEIINFRPIQEGLTNTSYSFEVKNNKYVYRHPGEGTKAFINRENEKAALKIAKKLGIDPTYIKMSSKEGWKISKYIEDTHSPDYKNEKDSKIVIAKMKELHDKNQVVDFEFNAWKDALKLERKIRKIQSIDMPDFNDLKNKIHKIFNKVDKDGLVSKRLCHCDTYKPNWLIKNDMSDAILIDWEYSGNSDPGVDVGYYIVDALYDFDEAKRFIKMYLGSEYSLALEEHYMSYVAIIAYYWFVWALYKQAIGSVMGEIIYNWYFMAKKYSNYCLRNYKYD